VAPFFGPPCRPSNYNPPALLISLLITIARWASWMNASKHRADIEQLARVFWIHLLDVCSMFARSCKRSIMHQFYLKQIYFTVVVHVCAALRRVRSDVTELNWTRQLISSVKFRLVQKLKFSLVHLRRSVLYALLCKFWCVNSAANLNIAHRFLDGLPYTVAAVQLSCS